MSSSPPPGPAHDPNIVWQATAVGKSDRAARLRQKPLVLWFTGLSGAGKTTVSSAAEALLHAQGVDTYLLDGDNLRHGLCSDLGFSPEDRIENIRRAGEVARLMVDAGLVVLASFISPTRRERDAVRSRFEPGEFHEVFVSTPLAVCEQRDPKGLYKLARAGKVAQFTGVSAPYEPPLTPEITLDTSRMALADCAHQVAGYVFARQ